MSAPAFEILRRAGAELRPTRSIGSGLKTAVNAGACLCIGDVHFATVEPRDAAHAGRIQAATEAVRVALRAAGWRELSKGTPL